MQMRFKLLEESTNFIEGNFSNKPIKRLLPGSHTRLINNNKITISEELLTIGNLESYSYSLEVFTDTQMSFQILQPQTHLIYHIYGRAPIRYSQYQCNKEYYFPPQHGVLFYIPTTVMTLHLKVGKYHIQGFNLPLDLLHVNGLAEFDYLLEIIEVYKRKPPQYYVSVSFIALEHTQRILTNLSAELSKNPIIPKTIILLVIEELLYLSKDKLLKAQGHLGNPEIMVHQARLLIVKRMAESDNLFLLKDIANELHIQPDYLNRLHKKRFGIPIMKYRNHQLLKKAKYFLDHKQSLKTTTLKCGFSEIASFCHFFKKETGMTPTHYLSITNKDLSLKKNERS